MSIAFLDPGNLEGDLQAGHLSRYRLLWVLLWATGVGLLLQLQAARLGVATGRDLAQHCRAVYPRIPRLALWLMMEVAVVGCDIQEVLGCGIAVRFLSGHRLPLWAGMAVGAVGSFVMLLADQRGNRAVEAMFASLVGLMGLSFCVMGRIAAVPLGAVARGLLQPRMRSSEAMTTAALLGGVLMPHNIYLHSGLVVSRGAHAEPVPVRRRALQYLTVDSGAALLVSLAINVSVVAVFASDKVRAASDALLGGADLGLVSAGAVLVQAFGPALRPVWGAGLLASGNSSTMTGTLAGQFIMSGLVEIKTSPLTRAVITRAVSLGPSLLVAGLAGHPAALDRFNQGINVLQALMLPFALVPLLSLTSNASVMGPMVTGPLTMAACVAAAAAGMVVNAAFLLVDAGPALASLSRAAAALGGPLLAGLLVLAVAASALGYLLLLVSLAATGVTHRGRPGWPDAVPESSRPLPWAHLRPSGHDGQRPLGPADAPRPPPGGAGPRLSGPGAAGPPWLAAPARGITFSELMRSRQGSRAGPVVPTGMPQGLLHPARGPGPAFQSLDGGSSPRGQAAWQQLPLGPGGLPGVTAGDLFGSTPLDARGAPGAGRDGGEFDEGRVYLGRSVSRAAIHGGILERLDSARKESDLAEDRGGRSHRGTPSPRVSGKGGPSRPPTPPGREPGGRRSGPSPRRGPRRRRRA